MLTLKELKKVVKVAGMTKRVPSEKALEKRRDCSKGNSEWGM